MTNQTVTIDTKVLEQLVRMLEQCLDDAIQVQCDLEQGYSKSLALAQMVQVELSKEAITAGRAALANAEPRGWQPIDTAPKDGATIIVGYGRQSTFPVKVVFFNTIHKHWSHYGDADVGLESNATHWMPLPAAPGETP